MLALAAVLPGATHASHTRVLVRRGEERLAASGRQASRPLTRAGIRRLELWVTGLILVLTTVHQNRKPQNNESTVGIRSLPRWSESRRGGEASNTLPRLMQELIERAEESRRRGEAAMEAAGVGPGAGTGRAGSMSAAQLVDREWFSATAPVGVLEERCEALIADADAGADAGAGAGAGPEGDVGADAGAGGEGGAAPFAAYLERLRAASSLGSPCTTVWMSGSVAYRCRTCQTGEASSICVACFKAGNHRDHDYIMYRSETGGVCDCGDLESWAEAGCCEVHAPRKGASLDADTAGKVLPAGPTRDAAEAVFGVVLERWGGAG